jgi:hypothetical protein
MKPKTILCILVLLAIAMMLCACPDDGTADPTATPQTEEQKDAVEQKSDQVYTSPQWPASIAVPGKD